jgi:ketosteroid isomerase-like protein
MDTTTVANRLTELCAAGKHMQALKELYADNARHVEAMAMPGTKQVIEGKAALVEMSEHWDKVNTVHGCTCGKPLVNGDQFVCDMSIDITHGEGPMAGQRMNMSEVCLYTVKNGKITEAKFFYPTC